MTEPVHNIMAAVAQQIEVRAYKAGWWYGLLCGMLVGGCTTGLGLLLVQALSAALACPTC